MRTRLRAGLAAAATTLAVGALAAPAANAGLLSLDPSSCGNEALSQPFKPWLDPASYVLAPGGAFEPGDQGWTLTGGAAVQDGNESFNVHADGDSHSLALPPGSSATSPAMCTSVYRPTLRFFARNEGAALSTLKVDVISPGLLGKINIVPLAVISGKSWNPTLPLPVLSSLTSVLGGGNTSLAFRFTAAGGGGDWSIDDVYVDPMGRR